MYSAFSPVAGSRVKATPEPEVPPLLPYTMVCTHTAVPATPPRRWMRRYSSAFLPDQERNTASAAAVELVQRRLRESFAGEFAVNFQVLGGDFAQCHEIELARIRHAAPP